MKTKYSIFVMIAAVAPLAISVPLYAVKMDDRIESLLSNRHVFKTYLKGDDT